MNVMEGIRGGGQGGGGDRRGKHDVRALSPVLLQELESSEGEIAHACTDAHTDIGKDGI